MKRKAQSEIITTVLIILLVLAAVFIVWQAVKGTVTKGTTEIESQSACMDSDLSITDAKNITTNPAAAAANISVTVARGSDSLGSSLNSIKVILINASSGLTMATVDVTTGIPAAFETKVLTGVTSSVALGKLDSYTVKIAPKIGTTQCDPVATKTFVAA